ncbi:hypothetical protein P153DRAFT_116920 [Dothidotthia symphoricarpi CBS 119687]|uniref:Uncharacterized protein n=1 Tax=Dothidotthia symphoricarpi CBS 119687 TaxID=1392245 RepID=A0A6A6A181_9PLEO|nr:uncharacterized protein P153DRAFT_116920 [Dothidotthia symphoricarpi CBS 119687]KAF2124955.1 hypothetical protein P153DRAFT_116920 [Dothidotthia symphoricarpi CBS 119687]
MRLVSRVESYSDDFSHQLECRIGWDRVPDVANVPPWRGPRHMVDMACGLYMADGMAEVFGGLEGRGSTNFPSRKDDRVPRLMNEGRNPGRVTRLARSDTSPSCYDITRCLKIFKAMPHSHTGFLVHHGGLVSCVSQVNGSSCMSSLHQNDEG